MTVTYNDGLEYQGVKVPDPPPFQYGNRTVRQFDFQTWTWSHISAGSGSDTDALGSGNTWHVKNRASFQAPIAATQQQSVAQWQMPKAGDMLEGYDGLFYKVEYAGQTTRYSFHVEVESQSPDIAGHVGARAGSSFWEELRNDGTFRRWLNGSPVKTNDKRPFFNHLFNHPWFQATLAASQPVMNASGQVIGQTVPGNTPTPITTGQLFVMAKSDKAHYWGESIPNDGGWHKVEWEINSGKACRLWIDGVGAVPSPNYGMCVRDLDTQPGVSLPPGTMTYLPGQNVSVSAGINIAVSASVPSSGFIPNEYWSTPGLHSRPKEEKKPCCITSYNNGGYAKADGGGKCWDCAMEGR